MSPEQREGFDPDELPPWETGPRMVSTRADQIIPSRPTWLWRDWLPSGALSLLVGRQGCGKSTFAAWLTGQVTRGHPFPGERSGSAPVAAATMSLEEADDRLVARLHAAEADLECIHVLSDVEDIDDDGRHYRRPWRLPKDCSVLEAFIADREIGLLVVDGLGYSITGDSHNYAVVGSALSALAGVAERTGCAIVGLTHPPKGSSDPVTAAIGSTAWTAIPRVVWVLGVDPEDDSEQRRVVRVSKTNYRVPEHGIGFVIGNDESLECGFVTGLALSSVSAEELVAARQTEDERSERDEARDLLRSVLSAGPMSTGDVKNLARDAGLTERMIKRARSDLGVRSQAIHDPMTGRMTGWMLTLPDQGTTPALPPVDHPLGVPLDPLGTTRDFVPSTGPVDHPTGSGPLVANGSGLSVADDLGGGEYL